MAVANQADFLGEGVLAPVQAPRRTPEQIRLEEEQRIRANEIRGLDANGNPLPAYGTPRAQGGTATRYDVTPIVVGKRDAALAPKRIVQYDANDRPAAVDVVLTGSNGTPQRPSTPGFRPLTSGDPEFDPTYQAPIQRPDLPLYPSTTTRITNPTAPTAEDAAEAPKVNTERIDALLGDINRIQAQIQGLQGDDEGFAESRAQLEQSLELAKQHATGLARGGSARARSALIAQSMGDQAALTAEGSQQRAVLTAQQEEQKRALELDVQKTAAELGLNEGALGIRTEGLNLASASNYLTNLFQENGINLRIDEKEATRVTEFIRDLALIERDYAQLDQNDKNALLDRLAREHGIDERTRIALGQIAANEPSMVDVGLGLVKTAGPLIALAFSDERVKHGARDATDAELEELLTKFKGKVYTYNSDSMGKGDQFGGMAQDLERSKLGRGMVDKGGAVKTVDGGKAGMAALAGLSMVYDRLAKLEGML